MSDAPPPIVTVKGLTKIFDTVRAVDGIDFSVERGSITALLGGNGAGKTTTLSMLLGLLLPDAGTISILGEDMIAHRHRVLPKMNFSSPYVDLPARLKVVENLTVYGNLYGLANVKERIAVLGQELEIANLMDRRTGSLSAGQKTRVALAKALLNEPTLLLLDEPTASLDPDTGDWVRSYLEAYKTQTGATILLASHNMAEVERLCDHVLMMKAGRIEDEGAPRELISRYGRRNMEEVFLHLARNGEARREAS